tara:strand:- start:285 stop:602 length:318 start_codon:yes stop_codon:yes gene_type:complete
MISVTKGNTVSEGVDNMINAMMSDYARQYGGIKMYNTKVGKKYIKVMALDGGCTAFVVNTDKDSRFKLGDVLKAASWNAPARNSARGNVLEGGFPIEWTGPLYLR